MCGLGPGIGFSHYKAKNCIRQTFPKKMNMSHILINLNAFPDKAAFQKENPSIFQRGNYSNFRLKTLFSPPKGNNRIIFLFWIVPF